MGRAALYSALDGRQLLSSADDLPRGRSLPAEDDLSDIVDMDIESTVNWLCQLDASDVRQLLRELRAAFEEAIPGQDRPTKSSRRSDAAPLQIAAAPRRPRVPSQKPIPVAETMLLREPARLLEPVPARPTPVPQAPKLRDEAVLPELELVIVRKAPARRAFLRSIQFGFALAAAVIVMAIPWSFLVLPDWPTHSATISIPIELLRSEPRGNSSEPVPIQPSSTVGRGPVDAALATRNTASAEARSPASTRLVAKDVDALIQRGDRYLMARDVIAARSYYERAAAAGSGPAAFALGRTFDPDFLAQIGASTVRPDAERAAYWYRVANPATAGRQADAPARPPRPGSP